MLLSLVVYMFAILGCLFFGENGTPILVTSVCVCVVAVLALIFASALPSRFRSSTFRNRTNRDHVSLSNFDIGQLDLHCIFELVGLQ